MNRNTLIIAVLLLAVGLLAGALVTRAQSSEWTGTKWEYASLTYLNVTSEAVFQQKEFDLDVISAIAKAGSSGGLLASLNYIGELGYEVVQMENVNNNGWIIFFKREIPS